MLLVASFLSVIWLIVKICVVQKRYSLLFTNRHLFHTKKYPRQISNWKVTWHHYLWLIYVGILLPYNTSSPEKVDYRRMGNMEEHLGNTTSTTFLHQSRNLWKRPRGTVLRIEALALVAIVLTFFVAVLGSCRRWSNHWIVQKGFLAANVLSLSLGTYSIGIMQSSSVKSEMYPIWTVCLFTL